MSLDTKEKRIIESWRQRRVDLLRKRMQGEIDAKLEEADSNESLSTPFLRVLVRSSAVSTKEWAIEEAMLTIWNPTEEQREAVNEGQIVRFKNLMVKDRFDGLLQLSAKSRTPIAVVARSVPKRLLNQTSSTKGLRSIFQVTLLSKEASEGRRQHVPFEVDVVAIVLKAEKFKDSTPYWQIHLTDNSGLVLRVQCSFDRSELVPLSFLSSSVRDNVDSCSIVAFRNLRVLPFDEMAGCAVVEFKDTSVFKQQKSPGSTAQEQTLRRWATAERGALRLHRLASAMDANVPWKRNTHPIVAIGYVHDFHVLSMNQILVEVDCGVGDLRVWKLPLTQIQDFLRICKGAEETRSTVVLNAEAEQRIAKTTSLERIYRARESPYRFLLQRLSSSQEIPAGFPECQYEVVNVSTVNTEALAGLYTNLSP